MIVKVYYRDGRTDTFDTANLTDASLYRGNVVTTPTGRSTSPAPCARAACCSSPCAGTPCRAGCARRAGGPPHSPQARRALRRRRGRRERAAACHGDGGRRARAPARGRRPRGLQPPRLGVAHRRRPARSDGLDAPHAEHAHERQHRRNRHRGRGLPTDRLRPCDVCANGRPCRNCHVK